MARSKGILSLVKPPKRPKAKQIISPSSSPEARVAMGGWVGVSLADIYKDTRPLWGEPRPLEKGWTPSSMGSECDRQTVLKVLGYRGDEFSGQLLRIFDMGNAIEDLWEMRTRKMGVFIDRGRWIQRTEPPIIRGKMDIRVRHPQEPDITIIMEIKSINSNGFRALPPVTLDVHANFKALIDLPGQMKARVRGYMIQLQMYMREDRTPSGILLFECKDNSDYADYAVVSEEAWMDALYARLVRLEAFRERSVLPPCTCAGKGKRGLFCKHKAEDEVPLDELKSLIEVAI